MWKWKMSYFTTCELVFTSVLRSSAFVDIIW